MFTVINMMRCLAEDVSNTRAHRRTHTHTHAYTHAHTHTHTHAHTANVGISACVREGTKNVSETKLCKGYALSIILTESIPRC